MAQVYRTTDNGDSSTVEQYDGAWNFERKTEKTLQTLSGSGEWKFLHGVKLMVDPSGVIIKGPDIFISRKFEDVKNLSYSDTFGVMRSVARATMATNKSQEDHIDKSNREKAWNEAVTLLNSILKQRKDYEFEKTRYLYPSK